MSPQCAPGSCVVSLAGVVLLAGSAWGGYHLPALDPGARPVVADVSVAAGAVDAPERPLMPAWIDVDAAPPSRVALDPLVPGAGPPADLAHAMRSSEAGHDRLTNFRGRRVTPARIPYFDDFEHRTIGAEWRILGSTRGELSTFAGPFGVEPQFLDIETLSETGYLVTFDLYVIEPGDAGSTFAVEVDGVVMYEESLGALQELAAPEGSIQVPVLREMKVGFVATGTVTEIAFASVGRAGQQWGLDNVRIEVDPTVQLSAMDEESGAGGGGLGTASPGHKAQSKRKPGAKARSNRGGRGGSSGGVTPPDFMDLFDDDPEDIADDSPTVSEPPAPPTSPTTVPMPGVVPPGENPTQSEIPDDPRDPGEPDDPDVPAPGTGSALLLVGAAVLRRRR